MFPIKWELISSDGKHGGAASEQQPWQAASGPGGSPCSSSSRPEIHCEEGRRVTPAPSQWQPQNHLKVPSRKSEKQGFHSGTSSSNTYYKAMRRTFAERSALARTAKRELPHHELNSEHCLDECSGMSRHRPTWKRLITTYSKIRQSLSLVDYRWLKLFRFFSISPF